LPFTPLQLRQLDRAQSGLGENIVQNGEISQSSQDFYQGCQRDGSSRFDVLQSAKGYSGSMGKVGLGHIAVKSFALQPASQLSEDRLVPHHGHIHKDILPARIRFVKYNKQYIAFYYNYMIFICIFMRYLIIIFDTRPGFDRSKFKTFLNKILSILEFCRTSGGKRKTP